MNFTYLSFLGSAVFISACGVNPDGPDTVRDLADIKYNEYAIYELTYLERPYIREYVRSFTMDNFDQDSVPMYVYDGTPYYHPVYTSMFGISFVDGYVRTGDSNYLKLAERIANRLVENANVANNQFLFPYNFDYTYSSGDFLKSPWYSGMAQGRLLTLFTRLYNVTEDQTYLDWAGKTFESLKLLKNQDEDWVGYIDEDYFYWIEEYPVDSDPVHVLNGFIYAIFGIYDYYLATENPEVLRLLNASITTIEYYIGEYRNPGGISYYDLKNNPTNPFYHEVHIAQLTLLSKITGESYFKEMADLFTADYQSTED